jgi:hypothetical protein
MQAQAEQRTALNQSGVQKQHHAAAMAAAAQTERYRQYGAGGGNGGGGFEQSVVPPMATPEYAAASAAAAAHASTQQQMESIHANMQLRAQQVRRCNAHRDAQFLFLSVLLFCRCSRYVVLCDAISILC